MASPWDAMVLVGRVARPHGLAGHVVIDPETDFPDARFRPGQVLYVRRHDRVEALTIAAVRWHRGRPILAFDGIATLEAARALAGQELRVDPAALVPLPPGTYYRHDLVGCTVATRDGTVVGRVTSVEGPFEASRLVVQGPRGEVLVPLAASICVAIDPARQHIVIDAPEGLLELNAPRWRSGL